jgi:hypothetical protein
MVGARRTRLSLAAVDIQAGDRQRRIRVVIQEKRKTGGSGEGAAWQKLTKACPAFATEYAAVVVRKSGGHLGEFGPLRKHKAQVAPVCESMLSEVQKLVESNPELCSTL